MTDQTKRIQELEQTVAQLKIRVFDMAEHNQQQAQLTEGFKGVVTQIADIVGLSQDAEITTDDVLQAVRDLVEAPEVASAE